MKKLICLLLCFVMSLMLVSCNSQNTSKGELNILTWADYVPDEVVSNFENETGIKVNYSNFNTNEEMIAKLQAAKGGQYDIVICSDYIIDLMRNDGNLIQKIDKEKVPNFVNIDEKLQNQYYDPDNEYTVPYTVASAVIVYDSSKVDFEIKGYKDLWNEKLKDSIVLLDGDRDIIGLTLQKMNKSVNETDEKVVNLAGKELLQLKPNVIGFDANTPHEMIINGMASVGYMYGSQASSVLDAVPTAKFVYPEEGMGVYIDNIVIPANAPNYENANIFINYILDGKVSAKISSIINYINANKAAKEYLPEEYKNNPLVNIPDDILSKAEPYKDLGKAKDYYDKIWTNFKSN